jgi:hypothetical protein
MTVQEWEQLTGKTATSNTAAMIAKAQAVLETLLGYTLGESENEYVEIGKTAQTCPCPNIDMDNLEDPDEVQGDYRLFPYHKEDKYLAIDPATEVYAVKLVKDGLTFKTLTDIRFNHKGGVIQFIEQCETCTCDFKEECFCVQLAVDADWTVPDPLLHVWADMVTFYSNDKQDIKSETLGPHSYTKFDRLPEDKFKSIIQKYAGPNGTAYQMPV